MAIQEELDSLQRTLNHAIDAFRSELIAAKLPPLSLQATEPHPLDDYAYLASPRLYEARRLTLATIGQLKNLIQYPFEKVHEKSFSVYNRAGLDVMAKTGLADFLGGVPDRRKGAHVEKIEKALDIDSRKLSIVLRFLSTEGWVRETDEGVFALNRPGFELLAGTNGRKLIGNMYVPEIANTLVKWLQHPEWKHSDSVVHTPVQMVHNTELPLFQWLKTRPDAFISMAETIRVRIERAEPPLINLPLPGEGDAYIRGVLADYPWDSLQGRTTVDCGGGQGFLSIHLAKAFPSLRFVIQDLPEVIELTQSHLKAEFPDTTNDGRIVAEVQDFFAAQARRGNDYNYMFRYVLHDWADDEAIKILHNIAEAAGPESKVIIVETISTPGIIQTSSPVEADAVLDSLDSETYEQIPAPAFIPANFGAVARPREILVLHLLSLMNAQSRTLMGWKKVIKVAGLEVRRVVPLRANVSIIECGLPLPA